MFPDVFASFIVVVLTSLRYCVGKVNVLKLGAELLPFDVNNCPDSPGATDWTGFVDVVPPTKTPLAVMEETPIPPLGTVNIFETYPEEDRSIGNKSAI